MVLRLWFKNFYTLKPPKQPFDYEDIVKEHFIFNPLFNDTPLFNHLPVSL